MKPQATLEVDTKGPLKVRRRTIIYTGQSSRQQTQEDRTEEEAQEDKEDEILEEDVTSGSVNSKSSPQSLGACSKTMPVKPSEVERWTYVTPKKLHKKHMSSPQVHQWERGQSSSCSPPEQCENVGDNETLTRRSSIPITMRDIFPEDFFNYSVKAPCSLEPKLHEPTFLVCMSIKGNTNAPCLHELKLQHGTKRSWSARA
ncbi:hypothetical protein ACFX13_013796 [Malus domestica]